jgi:hypothetical protein
MFGHFPKRFIYGPISGMYSEPAPTLMSGEERHPYMKTSDSVITIIPETTTIFRRFYY